jgi:dTDP-N-acetylfucosamine:lipid II N-acetylfucosaminyltransferase
MKNKPIVHILAPDKFTLPLINFLNQEMSEYNQIFIAISKPTDEHICALPNVFYLKNPHKKYFFSNTIIILKYFIQAKKIILHGNSILYFFYLFPFALKKTYWVIYGHSDLGTEETNKEKNFYNYIKKKVLKKIPFHITHVEGDSNQANTFFKSTAKLIYSPMYLSNVIDTKAFENKSNVTGTINILLGNSTDPSNCHFELFEKLFPYKHENIKFYCPLSYGPYNEYRDKVIEKGKALFGEKFEPMVDFMDLNTYRLFLNSIDIALFNHKSQTAMGVITSLLAMDKVVYLQPNITSFQSLHGRGFQIFDINEIEKGNLLAKKDIAINKKLINQYYSIVKLNNSYQEIYK